MNDVAVGIDLGTTHSVVAVADGGQAVALSDEFGRTLLPSVVSFPPEGSIVVGYEARERRLTHATDTIYSVKRLLGRPFDSEEVREAQRRFAFTIKAGNGGAIQVEVSRGAYALPEISAHILRKLRDIAEDGLGRAVANAVITVPANFNELQRSATKAAGQVAGLNVMRILNEPTAAALAYGYGRERRERVAVYDFGGGTFDITILELEGDVFEVVSTAGDNFLGGDDVDLAIAELIANQCLQEHGFDPRTQAQTFERIRAAAEWTKCQLSAREDVELKLDGLEGEGREGGVGLHFTLQRDQLEAVIEPVVSKTFAVCDSALAEAGLALADIDSVILVGGSTRIPLVRRMVEQHFGGPARSDIDPDLVVAFGAAIHAHALAGSEQVGPWGQEAIRRMAHVRRSKAGSLVTKMGISQAAFAPVRWSHAGQAVGVAPRPSHPPPGLPSLPSLESGLSASEGPVMAKASLGKIAPPTVTSASWDLSDDPDLVEFLDVEDEVEMDKTSPFQQSQELVDELEPDEELQMQLTPLDSVSDHERPTLEVPIDGLPELDDDDMDDVAMQSPAPGSGDSNAHQRDTLEFDQEAVQELRIQSLIPAHVAEPIADPDALGLPSPQDLPTPDVVSKVAVSAAPIVVTGSPEEPANLGTGLDQEALFGDTISLQDVPESIEQPVLRLPDRAPPLLMDVTPHSLGVELAGGYCQHLIARNSPVPSEQARVFSPARDGQQEVAIRICQGESSEFADNETLGEVQLTELPDTVRTDTRIEVTFILDANGTLKVQAKDEGTGRVQSTHINLRGGLGSSDVEAMRQRQESELAAPT